MELVEKHRITYPAAPVGDTGTTARIHAACQRAERWADAHGMELGRQDIGVTTRRVGNHQEIVGVAFEVHVGHGDIHADQRTPGVLDRWRWSSRMAWWRRVLGNTDGRQGRVLARREDGMASVTEMPVREYTEAARASYWPGEPPIRRQ